MQHRDETLHFVVATIFRGDFTTEPFQNLEFQHGTRWHPNSNASVKHHKTMDRIPKSVVFITGTFLASSCWDEWKLYLQSEGYTCLALAWPHKNFSPEELRSGRHDADIASTRLASLTKFYAEIIKALHVKPILIGHSVGGLIVQLLLQQGLGAAGVAIHSFPPSGILRFGLLFLNNWWQTVGVSSSVTKPYRMSFEKWKNDIANDMPDDQQIQSYYNYSIPESKLVVRDAFSRSTLLNSQGHRAPLLLTSGGRDQLIPSWINYKNYEEQKKQGHSTTDYKKFKDSNHLVFGQSECMDETEFIVCWLKRLPIKTEHYGI
jgi:pimeloyl-ACP methyl ester carboxylesterase